MDYLEITFLGNSILNYIISLALFFLFLLLFKIFQKIILVKIEKISEKTKTDLDRVLVKAIRRIRPSFYKFLSLFLALKLLSLHSLIEKVLDGLFIIVIVYQAIVILQLIIDYSVKKYFIKDKDREAQHAVISISKISKGLLWVFGILLVFSNLGINITSLVAGLGIGGLAVAIAIQNILSDLFSSFAIYFDKPFTVGDFIVVGNNMGIVEKIGIKTTRIRALQGEEVVISNHELISSRIQNFKKMKERRVVFNFGVEYATPLNKLKKIPSIVEEIVTKEKLTRFDRAHFHQFSDSSLSFEVVYYILSGDYNEFMDSHQSILFQIKERTEKEKISMAFPSRTVYIKK